MERKQKYLVTTYRVRQYLIFVFTAGCCHLILRLSSFQGQIFKYDHYFAWTHIWNSSEWQKTFSLNLKPKILQQKTKTRAISISSEISLHEHLHAFMTASWSELTNYIPQQNVFQKATKKNQKYFMSSICVPYVSWFFKNI
jgi:hypothetical protein